MRFIKWAGIAFCILVLLGMVISVVDPEGVKRRAEKAAAAESKNAELKKASDKVFQHGFVVGHAMAKSGAVKPSADEVDAMARKSALELGNEGGTGFKMHWKQAFWAGWNKGD